MKIRLDFVSNSSSSSFMLVGCCFEEDQLQRFAKKHALTTTPTDDSDDKFDESIYDVVEKLEKKFPELHFEEGIEDYYNSWCVGLEYDDMKKAETREEFEARVAKELQKMTSYPESVQVIIDGGTRG